LKFLAGLPSDVVEVSDGRTSLNGVPLPGSDRRRLDSAARLLPRLPAGRYTVPAGHLWLYSGLHPASWDSRYYGPVPASGLEGVATPLFP
jgi:type IV secretory pathway protease TraF